jgi:hypothetical protein
LSVARAGAEGPETNEKNEKNEKDEKDEKNEKNEDILELMISSSIARKVLLLQWSGENTTCSCSRSAACIP